jgi:hypothetical protein
MIFPGLRKNTAFFYHSCKAKFFHRSKRSKRSPQSLFSSLPSVKPGPESVFICEHLWLKGLALRLCGLALRSVVERIVHEFARLWRIVAGKIFSQSKHSTFNAQSRSKSDTF